MDYKITKVSSQPPKEHGEGERKVYYIKVQVEGHDKPISVGKKKPDALNVGDVISGTITPTEYDTDNFKPTPKAYGGKQVDTDGMYRCNALNNAVAMFQGQQAGDITVNGGIRVLADEFYAWLKNEDKIPDPQAEQSLKDMRKGYEEAKKTAEELRPEKPEEVPTDKELEAFDENGEVNLDDIPF